MAQLLVQYVIVRGDLMKSLGWPVGAVIAQCCHATTAVGHMYHEDDHLKQYFSDLDNMHKVVLEAKDDTILVELSKVLTENDIKHKLWIEQPENIPTCVAVKPYPKETVHPFVKKFKLYK